MTAYAAELTEPRHLVFDFALLHTPWSAAAFADGSEMHEQLFTGDRWPSIVLGNHDNSRPASRLAPTRGRSNERRGRQGHCGARAHAARDAIPVLRRRDRGARRAGPVRRRRSTRRRNAAGASCAGSSGGGTATRLEFARCPGATAPTAASRPAARGSAWPRMSRPGRSPSRSRRQYVRAGHVPPRPVALGRRHPALQTGTYRRLAFSSPDIYAFERAGEGESIVVAVNFGRRPVTFRIGTRQLWTR